MAEQYPLLDLINSPHDLRELPRENLTQLANELREFLIESVSQSGGHFSAGLGTVELTVALHYIFNTPQDQLIWDVGHQAYPHKILTGRKESIQTIRRKDGISAFPKRSESEYDSFGVGHSSTSISAALGMAIAAQLDNREERMVAIIGDGGMTGGMAFEALNHAGAIDANILVILNDNDMSISPNVGAMSNYLAKILSSKLYSNMKRGSKKVLGAVPPVWELAKRTEEHLKGMIVPGVLFEELGFNYIGPIDGHDMETLVSTLQNIQKLEGPQFLHIVTQKGKGYLPAENDPTAYHGVSSFDPELDELPKSEPTKSTYTQVFGQWLCDMAEVEPKLLGITPAMREGSGLFEFSQRFPERYFDVGIAEQHAVTLAAGMACQNYKPVVAIYSTFLQRAYDQLIHDVSIQNLPILFAIDRAGIVGPDGPTHAGIFDFSFMRCLPNMVIMAPSDENECRQMLYTGFLCDGPAAIRYPRGFGPGVEVSSEMAALPIGEGRIVREGKKIAILAFGSMVSEASSVAENLNASLVDMRFVKPIDEALIKKMSNQHEFIITIEENSVMAGAGSAVNEYLLQQQISLPVLNIGLPDEYPIQGSREEVFIECQIDSTNIEARIRQFSSSTSSGKKQTRLVS
jgi:1-deoxy-D-xylulose-5-phosphate synthase